MKKLFRVSTIPMSLNLLLKGQLKYLNQFFDVTAISGDGPDLEEVEAREEVRTYSIEMQRQISPLKDLLSLIDLYLYFRKEKPFIVHSITPKAGLLSMVAAKFAGVPHRVHTFTGLIFPYKKGFTQKILILMDKILCACATRIYPEGEGVKKDLERFGITKKKLQVLGNGNVNGINPDYFNKNTFSDTDLDDLRKSLGIYQSDFVFLFVGRLVGDKGINELVSAFEDLKLIPENKNIKLLLVGPGEAQDPLHPETVRSIHSNKNIISVGYQKDVRPYFAISDSLVFPSYREGFPNVVMQAGAMELPSIVTDISGCNEIIINKENGLIIPVKDKDALKDAMKMFLLNKEFYYNLKKNSRPMIIERYNQSLVWETIFNEYKSFSN